MKHPVARPLPASRTATLRRRSGLEPDGGSRFAPFTASALLALVAVAVTTLLAGCGRLGLGADGDRAAAKARPGDEQVALVLDGRDITVGELNERMKDQFLDEFLRQPEDRQFEMREQAVREMVQRHVVDAEAKKKGLTAEGLYEEVTAAAPKVTVEDVSTWYKDNEARLQGAPLEQIAPQIEKMLTQERRGEAWNAFIDPKLEALDWKMVLSPPRQTVEATKLVRGPADAPVTLILFSDYQCPYCIRSEKVLAQLLAKYPKEVRVVQRHFPLEQIHPFARPAAEASMCADEQGRFWEFHDAIFALEGKLEADSFTKIGAKLGLDEKALATCISDHRFKDYVDTDLKAGEAVGVTGTPAFFINGIPMKGARDLDDLSRVVDGELARLAKS